MCNVGARLQILGGDPLFVDESATEAAQQLQAVDRRGYAELHKSGKPVLVNPAAVACIDEAGTPKVQNLADAAGS